MPMQQEPACSSVSLPLVTKMQRRACEERLRWYGESFHWKDSVSHLRHQLAELRDQHGPDIEVQAAEAAAANGDAGPGQELRPTKVQHPDLTPANILRRKECEDRLTWYGEEVKAGETAKQMQSRVQRLRNRHGPDIELQAQAEGKASTRPPASLPGIAGVPGVSKLRRSELEERLRLYGEDPLPSHTGKTLRDQLSLLRKERGPDVELSMAAEVDLLASSRHAWAPLEGVSKLKTVELVARIRLYGEEPPPSASGRELQERLRLLRRLKGEEVELRARAEGRTAASRTPQAVVSSQADTSEPAKPGEAPVLRPAPAMVRDPRGSQVAFAQLQAELLLQQQERKDAASAGHCPVLAAHGALEAAGLLAPGRLRAAISEYLHGDATGAAGTLEDSAARNVLASLDAQLLSCHDLLLEDLTDEVLSQWALEPKLLAEDRVGAVRSGLYGGCRFPILLKELRAARGEDSPQTGQRRQLVVERVTQSAAVKEYLATKAKMAEEGRAADLGSKKRVWTRWVQAMSTNIVQLREGGPRCVIGRGAAARKMLLDPTLDPELLAVITCQTLLNLVFLPSYRRKDDAPTDCRVPFVTAVVAIGEAVELEQSFRTASQLPKGDGKAGAHRSSMAMLRFRRQGNTSDLQKLAHTVPLGSALVDVLLDTALIEVDPSTLSVSERAELWPPAGDPGGLRPLLPAFFHRLEREGPKTVGFVGLQPHARKQMDLREEEIMAFIAPKYQPMVVQPRPWKPAAQHPEGGYLLHQVSFIRTTEQNMSSLKVYSPQRVARVMDGLGQTPWRVNEEILKVLRETQRRELAIAEVPPRLDPEVPDLPEDFSSLPEAERKSLRLKRMNAQKRAQELQSERPTFELKLRVAEDFLHAPQLYFPHNVDFRGRAYPVPPHLNHISDDICRGLLMFAQPKPLGDEGLFWLKVCLSNLMGKNKVSFEDRVAYVDSCKDWIIAVARDPLEPAHRDRWANADDGPWQALARCQELARIWALEEEGADVRSFKSCLPVQLDGTCNGLQHYAALGRDEAGGMAVNLTPSERPQDVYSVVLEFVKKKVHADASLPPPPPEHAEASGGEGAKRRPLQDRRLMAQRIIELGALQRKVVKQTIMTVCYGVTTLGARHQVLGQLEDMAGETVDPRELGLLAGYLSSQVLHSIDEVFERAMRIKMWFDTISGQLARLEVPTSWISPIGLACVQPYRKARQISVATKRQKVTLVDESGPFVDKSRQRMGFPPNFIHSLDSSHMMMVAEGCQKRGITFAGVHDSFWTHACDAPALNKVIREAFVDLHSRPILEELHEDLRVHLGGAEPPPLPKQGSLDIKQALTSRYIFG